MENKRKIKILGAGLAGLTAAINLVKNGYQVDIYEKNEDIGMRFCGDFQGLENWSEKKDILEELREMNIYIDFDYTPFFGITLTNCTESKDISSKRPLFYLVKRGSFPETIDYSLKEQALKIGAKIYFKKTIKPEEADIVSTGPVLGKNPGIAKGIVFKTNFKNTAIMLINDDLAFKAYSYLFIINGHGCMCSVVVKDLNKINDCFEKTKDFFTKKFNLDIQSLKNVGSIGCPSLKNTFRNKNTLYTGEAAGLQDFLWGFGMRFAITSGYLAAKSVINGNDYEKIAKDKFKNKLKASIVNRYLWEKLSKNNYSFFIKRAKGLPAYFYSFHNYNLLQKILYPFALHYIKKNYPNLT